MFVPDKRVQRVMLLDALVHWSFPYEDVIDGLRQCTHLVRLSQPACEHYQRATEVYEELNRKVLVDGHSVERALRVAHRSLAAAVLTVLDDHRALGQGHHDFSHMFEQAVMDFVRYQTLLEQPPSSGT